MYKGRAFGQGVWKSIDGCYVYKGYFRLDKRHGYGNLAITDNNRFEGEFSLGEFCGNFTKHSKDGKKFNQVWEDEDTIISSTLVTAAEDLWFNQPYCDIEKTNQI